MLQDDESFGYFRDPRDLLALRACKQEGWVWTT